MASDGFPVYDNNIENGAVCDHTLVAAIVSFERLGMHKLIHKLYPDCNVKILFNPNSRRSIFIFFIVGLLFIFLITACQFPSSSRTKLTPTPNPPSWLSDWLNKPVCKPPCWEGITPGNTTFTETEKILTELPWIKLNFGPEKPTPNYRRLKFTWQFIQPSKVLGYAYSDDEEDLTISLGFEGILTTKLKDVINNYGDPSHVFIADCTDHRCGTELLYIDSGMVIYLNPLIPDWKGFVAVSSETDIRGVGFFPPGRDGFLSAYPAYSESFPALVVPWEGYTRYRYLR